MSIKSKINDIVNFIEDLFLTSHKCISCGREVPDYVKTKLCETCSKNLSKISGEICVRCGESVVAGNKYCDGCKNMDYKFDENHSYAVYDDISGRVVKSLKYSGNKYIAKNIAEMLFEDKKYFEGVDYITFVPIGRERLKERGFNQAEEIAMHVSKLAGVPIIGTLEKIKENTHQAGLTRKERVKNIVNTIAVREKEKETIKGKVVLVIDDVFTTGSTLSECAKVLKKSGATKVRTLTFAKTKQNMININ